MPLWISGWDWDDSNVGELSRHGLDRRTVLDVAAENPRFRRNKRKRAATHQMIGPDRGGRFWTVCILRLHGERWRAITGWPSTPSEIEWHRKSS